MKQTEKKPVDKPKYLICAIGHCSYETNYKRAVATLKERLRQQHFGPAEGYIWQVPVNKNGTVRNYLEFMKPLAKYEESSEYRDVIVHNTNWVHKMDQRAIAEFLELWFSAYIDPQTKEVHFDPLF